MSESNPGDFQELRPSQSGQGSGTWVVSEPPQVVVTCSQS